MISSTLLSMLPSSFTDLSLTTILIALAVVGVASYFVYSRFFKKSSPIDSASSHPTVVENDSSIHMEHHSSHEQHQEAINMINSQDSPQSDSTPMESMEQSSHEMA